MEAVREDFLGRRSKCLFVDRKVTWVKFPHTFLVIQALFCMYAHVSGGVTSLLLPWATEQTSFRAMVEVAVTGYILLIRTPAFH